MLLGYIPDNETFFSLDGGSKTLLIKALLRDPSSVLPAPPASLETRALWEAGHDPLDGAIATVDGVRYSLFPLIFPILSAPFFLLFGHQGLYVLPFLGVLLSWLGMAAALIRLGMTSRAALIALTLSVATTHLIFYGAMFWEHSLATALFAWTTVGLLRPPASHRSEGLLGWVVGLGCWLRPEAGLLAACFVVTRTSAYGLRRTVSFALGSAIAVVSYVAWNLAVYGTPEGAHGTQVIDHYSGLSMTSTERMAELLGLAALHSTICLAAPLLLAVTGDTRVKAPLIARTGLIGLLAATVLVAYRTSGLHHPLAAALGETCLVAVAIYAIAFKLRPSKPELVMGATLLLFWVGLPWLVPNTGGYQIGPRYVLICIPLATIAVGHALNKVNVTLRGLERPAAWAFAGLLMVLGFNQTLDMTQYLRTSYQTRVSPALDSLLARPEKHVVTSDCTLPLELEAAAPHKAFYRASGERELASFCNRLGSPALHLRWTYSEPVPTASEEIGQFGEVSFARVCLEKSPRLVTRPSAF